MISQTDTTTPTFFASPADFREWLEQNHATATSLLVGFYKVGSGRPSMTWPESVDEALCFGWIDGVRRSIDADSYSIRFTPRKPKSTWSAVNIRKVEELTRTGRMQAVGLASYAKREESNSVIYSYEKEAVPLSTDFENEFKANGQAWRYFQAQAPSYQKRMIHWVMDARQEATKRSRLQKLIAACGASQRL
ncbi:YdeI/OmpD-associated family protein [Pontibacter roseus]|uniref:YdeI/OmpD-associated family protein n=1 Tax=Pontibacter roseus TaxID=336989 RepID=UPI00038283BB|nr:YdeI/OmpD-associated family protein [Pontibacter roseus]